MNCHNLLFNSVNERCPWTNYINGCFVSLPLKSTISLTQLLSSATDLSLPHLCQKPHSLKSDLLGVLANKSDCHIWSLSPDMACPWETEWTVNTWPLKGWKGSHCSLETIVQFHAAIRAEKETTPSPGPLQLGSTPGQVRGPPAA